MAESAVESDLGLGEYICEGKARIFFPKQNEVFYNPVQQFNRDLSILAIRTWSERQEDSVRLHRRKKRKTDNNTEALVESLVALPEDHDGVGNGKFTILEALSATGLRAVRYAKEIPAIKEIVANDFSASAVELIQKNVDSNQVGDKVKAIKNDANAIMHTKKKHFDVIDLDPYGTAALFLDAAVQSIRPGGLLCVTCTDSAVFAGAGYPEKTFANYGGLPVKGEFCHEAGIRLILHAIAVSAAKYGRNIVPRLSLSIDFYVRIFLTVHASPKELKNLAR